MRPADGCDTMDPVTSIFFDAIIKKLASVIQEGHTLRKSLRLNLQAMKEDFEILVGTVRDCSVRAQRSGEARQKWVRQIQDLAYEIEDCLDRHSSAAVDHDANQRLIRRWLGRVKTMDARTRFAEEMEDLRKRVKDAVGRKAMLVDVVDDQPSAHGASGSSYVPEVALVGINEPREEVIGLLELKGAEDCANIKSLKVVSIVGPRGLGKTALAWAVYDSLDYDDKFDCRAIVTASDCIDSKDLLKKILVQVEAAGAGDPEPCRSLRAFLRTKRRYFIVIDDLHLPHYWDYIKHAFPPADIYGRIIVTTSVDKIAKHCSSVGGDVYRMKKLSKEFSRDLFMRITFGPESVCETDIQQTAVDKIVDKCDGLPLALVKIGQHLKTLGDLGRLTPNVIEETCESLGNLQDLKNSALESIYNSLPEYDLKNCLLSVSIFPKSHPIKKGRLVRMWLAEGLVDKGILQPNEENKADAYFKELIDRNIIQPVDSSSSSNTQEKICKIHGVMLDLIVHKSVSENFITLVHSDKFWKTGDAVRRFSLQNTDPETVRTAMKMQLSSVRSLAIFEHDGKDLRNFQRCKLLRALVLEQCKELEGGVLNSICELMHLKYLSLKNSDVSKLPKKVHKLQALETLDLRGTKVDMLPMGVLTLPQLAHLFGRFHLPRGISGIRTNRKVQETFPERSELQTLTGFILDKESPGVMKHVMVQMKKLRKVKIWCADVPIVVPPLKIQFDKTKKALSVDFGDRPDIFLDNNYTQTPSLESMRLQGQQLTDALLSYILSLDTLLHLQVLSYDLDNKALEQLGSLKGLTSLEISSKHGYSNDVKFDVKKDGFPNLELLCFEMTKLPKVSIEVGSMPKLKCLKLLCEDVKGFDAEDMRKLKKLKEVKVPPEAKEAWEEVANSYTGGPTVKESTD